MVIRDRFSANHFRHSEDRQSILASTGTAKIRRVQKMRHRVFPGGVL